jgi:hypothetical protein
MRPWARAHNSQVQTQTLQQLQNIMLVHRRLQFQASNAKGQWPGVSRALHEVICSSVGTVVNGLHP